MSLSIDRAGDILCMPMSHPRARAGVEAVQTMSGNVRVAEIPVVSEPIHAMRV